MIIPSRLAPASRGIGRRSPSAVYNFTIECAVRGKEAEHGIKATQGLNVLDSVRPRIVSAIPRKPSYFKFEDPIGIVEWLFANGWNDRLHDNSLTPGGREQRKSGREI